MWLFCFTNCNLIKHSLFICVSFFCNFEQCLEWRERQDINKSLLSWEGPPEISKNFIWKFSGYDSEGRPSKVKILYFKFLKDAKNL